MTTRVRFVLVPFLMLLIQAIFIQIQFIYAQGYPQEAGKSEWYDHRRVLVTRSPAASSCIWE
jgi:hypothetical protein